MLGTVAIEINADKTSVEVHPKNVKRIPQIGEVYDLVEIETDRGTTVCHYYAAKEARNGVVMVGGAGGEFDTPARGLYPRLAQDLRNDRISTVRVHCRSPTSLVESVVDTVLGMNFLKSQGISAIGLVGYSFGGAVAIQAAGDPAVRAVVAVAVAVAVAATWPVAGPPGDAALLLLHGDADTVVSPRSSEEIYRRAREPKRLVIYEGAGHTLDEEVEGLDVEVKAWLLKHLPGTLV